MRDSGKHLLCEYNLSNHGFRQEIATCDDLTYAHFKIENVRRANMGLLLTTGNATVCGTRVGNKLYYGVSLCSPEDNFDRHIGRSKAREGLTRTDICSKRGVIGIEGLVDDSPAVLLRYALGHHLATMKRRPVWVKSSTIVFRGKYKKGLDK